MTATSHLNNRSTRSQELYSYIGHLSHRCHSFRIDNFNTILYGTSFQFLNEPLYTSPLSSAALIYRHTVPHQVQFNVTSHHFQSSHKQSHHHNTPEDDLHSTEADLLSPSHRYTLDMGQRRLLYSCPLPLKLSAQTVLITI